MKVSEELLERDLQAKCVAWWNGAGLPGILFHVPNEGKRGRFQAAALRALGVVAGVPDLVLLMESGRTALIELKVEGGNLSPSQMLFATTAIALGHKAYTVRSLAAFKDLVRELVADARHSVMEIQSAIPLP